MIQYKETKRLSKANVHSLNVTHKYKNIIWYTTFPLKEILWSVILRLSGTNSSCWRYNYTAPYDSHDWPRGFHVHYIHHTLWLQTWIMGSSLPTPWGHPKQPIFYTDWTWTLLPIRSQILSTKITEMSQQFMGTKKNESGKLATLGRFYE